MRLGRPKVALILTDVERVRLTSLAHRSQTAAQLARRARIVLACAAGHTNTAVAKRVRVSPATVGKRWVLFLRDRLDGLLDEPRPGPRTVTDAQVERVVIETLETTPPGAMHWSTRSLANATGLSRMTISRIWQVFGLRPHRSETFELSPDPLLIEKVRDSVGLYVDEKSLIQALDRSAPAADATGSSRTPHPRLQPAWDDVVVCGARRADRPGRRRNASSPSRGRNPEVPGSARRQCAARPGRAHHLRVLAEPHRALVRRADHQANCGAACIEASAHLKPRFASSSTRITPRAHHASGRNPRTRF